jgi:hypothetical protein
MTEFIFGDIYDCSTSRHSTCYGWVEYADNYKRNYSAYNVKKQQGEVSYVANSGALGKFSEIGGGNFGRSDFNAGASRYSGSGRDQRGSMLVRSTNVPEPSTLAIFALGLIGLASRRFKKH